MKKRVWSFRLGSGLSLLGAAIVLASLSGGVTAQTNQARMFVEAPTEQVKKGDADFKVDIVADNVSNLAAFQFSLTYDPSVIKYVSVEGGSFLGSTGREEQCLDPNIDGGNPEMLRFNCVTLGPPVSVQGAKAGASGSGVLATVTFSPIGGGTTALDLTEGRLIAAALDAQGNPAEVSTAVENSTLTVGSTGGGVPWMLLGPVIGVVAAVVVVGLVLFIVRLRARRPASLGIK
jgi:Cohesin domain